MPAATPAAALDDPDIRVGAALLTGPLGGRLVGGARRAVLGGAALAPQRRASGSD